MRPLSEREIQLNDDIIIDVISAEQILVRPDVRANGTSALSASQSTYNQSLISKSFTFNAVFDQSANQSEMMERSGIARIIEMAIDGYSTTVFCYGQTGSGKTHTLTGPPDLVSSFSSLLFSFLFFLFVSLSQARLFIYIKLTIQ